VGCDVNISVNVRRNICNWPDRKRTFFDNPNSFIKHFVFVGLGKVQMPSMMYCDYYYVYVLLSGAEKAGSLRCFPVVSQLWQRFKIFIKPSFTIMV